MDASELFQSSRLVPVIVLEDAGCAVDLALCLRDGGIAAVEITLRTEAGLPAIEAIASQVPDVIVGAGSVRQTAQMEAIAARGARFAVSPGSTEQLLQCASSLGLAYVPGAATATEIMTLQERGYRLQKFFPAEKIGGLGALKALHAPLPEVCFFPTGGIDAQLAAQYLALDYVSCVGGSWFVPPQLIRDRNFQEIGALTVKALQLTHAE